MTLAKAVEAARAALDDLIDLQKSALSLDARANGITAPEDKSVRALCERHGYGAVMDSAARQWHLRDGNGGGHTTYHSYSVVKKATIMAKKALAALPKKPMTEADITKIIVSAINGNCLHGETLDQIAPKVTQALKAANVLYVEKEKS